MTPPSNNRSRSSRWVGWVALALVTTVLAIAQMHGHLRAQEPASSIVPSSTLICDNLILNGGFETLSGNDAPPWVRSGNAIITDYAYNQGVYAAFLGGDDNALDSIYQQVTIPDDVPSTSTVTSVTLTYWWAALTEETDHPHDYLYVRIYDSTGQLLAEPEVISDGDAGIGAWTGGELDLFGYKGQTVRIAFEAETDAQNATAFFVDDVELEVCQTFVPTPTPTNTQTATITPTHTTTPVASATPTSSPTPVSVTFTWTEGGYQATSDAWMDTWYPDANYGKTTTMWIRTTSAKRPVIYFDVSSIPSGATVIGARLWLMADFYRSHPQTINVSVYGLKRAWTESQVTWNRARAGVNWGAPGADNTGSDRDSVATASRSLYDTVTWYDWDVTALVQSWVSGTRPNYGMLLDATGNTCEMHLLTSESSVPSQRPRLEVLYSAGGPPPATQTPTPGPTATPTAGPSPTATQVGVEIVLQRGLNGYASLVDTHISEWQPAENFASAPRLAVRQGGARSTLMRFNLDGVPSGVTVLEARVEMYCVARTNPGPMTISVTRLTKWFAPRKANWTRATDLLNWGIPGCKQVVVDLARRATSSTDVSTVGEWHSWDVTPLVQLWLDGARNNGMVFTGAGPASVEYNYFSSDSTWNMDRTPRLIIRYKP